MYNSYTSLLLLALVVSHASGSAIKGHSRPEDSRSLKGAPEKHFNTKALSAPVSPVVAGAFVMQQPAAGQAASIPVLESSKKVYNDESIRRLTQQPVVAEQAAPVVPVVASEDVAPQAKPDLVVAPVVPVAAPVVPVAAPVVPVAVDEVSKEEKVEQVVPVEKPLEMSERSSVVKQPVVEPQASPMVAEPVAQKQAVIKPVVAESAPVVVPVVAPMVEPVANSVPVAVEPVVPVAPVAPNVVQIQPVAPVVPVVQSVPSPIIESEAVKKQVPLVESQLQAKKDDVAQHQVDPLPELPLPDPGLVLSEPIDSATKLLIDLDEHVQKFLPQEEHLKPAPQDPVLGIDYSPADPKGKSSGPLMPYSLSVSEDAIVPPMPVLDGVEKSSSGSSSSVQASPASPVASPASPLGSVSSQSSAASSSGSSSSSSFSSPSSARQGGSNHHHGQGQNQQQVITQLMDQLDSLQNRIQDTINQLVARRRYVMSALLRPMGTYVRRVRTNLERLQNRVNQLQAAASSVGNGQNRPGGFVDAAAIETIRRRIDDISKRISDIVTRIRFSLTPTSAPLNSNGK